MVTVERFLIVRKGKLYELRTDGDSASCVFSSKYNAGPCPGCMSRNAFTQACRGMSKTLGAESWCWKELR